MSTRVGVVCDIGRRRENNQDSWLVCEPEDSLTLKAKGKLYVVADGIGGAAAGEVASKLVAETVKKQYFSAKEPNPLESLKRAVLAADETVREQGRTVRDRGGMGSTLTAVAVVGGNAYLAHVGDSRAYIIRGQRITQLTTDQTVTADLVRQGKISTEQAKRHPQRHLLTQSVGGGRRPPVVDLISYSLQAKDVLVVCSDGLYNVVGDAEIREIVTKNANPQRAAEMLADLANERGGPDNITVMVIERRGVMPDFLDKVREGISKGVNAVSVRSKELVEVTKLKAEIDSLQRRKKDTIEELGNVVYVMLSRDNFDQSRMMSKYQEIARLDQQIRAKEEELQRLRVEAQTALGKAVIIGTCECGAPVSLGARFCARCGRKVNQS